MVYGSLDKNGDQCSYGEISGSFRIPILEVAGNLQKLEDRRRTEQQGNYMVVGITYETQAFVRLQGIFFCSIESFKHSLHANG